MTSIKNCSQAETISRKPRTKSVIARVMSGESFRIMNDKTMGFSYRFEREESGDFTFYINNLLVGVCRESSFFPMGFVITLNMLGEVRNHSVLCDDIRFSSVKGGVQC